MAEARGDTREGGALERTLLARALAARDPGRLHLRFHSSVVDRYRERAGATLLRTRSVGRVALPGRWTLDMGIAEGPDGEILLHLPVGDLLDRLPEEEWEHWTAHLATGPASDSYLQMRMTPAACIDDGEPGAWE